MFGTKVRNILVNAKSIEMDTASLNVPEVSRFEIGLGSEIFFAFEAPVGLTFTESVSALFETYNDLMLQNELSADTEVWLRFHLSDITNQGRLLKQMLGMRKVPCFYSTIGQAPASGSKVAMEAYHISSPAGIIKEIPAKNALIVRHGEYSSLWVRNLPSKWGCSDMQTREIFDDLGGLVQSGGGSIRDNVMRTWIYIRDVDNNYQGMVDQRREWFKREGLTTGTHFIASTGIEGCAERVTDLVQMDSLSVFGISPDQVEYMSAPEYLNPTYEYGVTFERATRIMYGDRSHYYVSGTASIDSQGNIRHIGDVEKQAQRTLVNIQALLSRYGSDLGDMKIMTVYLRDTSDFERISGFLKENIPAGIPYIIVRGAVCRPLWLIEMEGIAVSSVKNEEFMPFC